MSNNLDLTQLTSAQENKEVTINDQSGELDAALTVAVDIAVDNTNAITLTDAQFRENNTFHIVDDSPVPTAAITVTVPAISRGQFVVVNETSFAVTVEVSGQSVTSPIVSTGVSETGTLLICDGVDCRSAGGGGGGASSTVLNFSNASNVVASSSTVSFDLTSFMDRGIMYKIVITETGGVSTGTYDVRMYARDTKVAADLLYSVDAIDSTADSRIYTDQMCVFYIDKDSTEELHIQFDNNDGAQSMTFTIAVDAEKFAVN